MNFLHSPLTPVRPGPPDVHFWSSSFPFWIKRSWLLGFLCLCRWKTDGSAHPKDCGNCTGGMHRLRMRWHCATCIKYLEPAIFVSFFKIYTSIRVSVVISYGSKSILISRCVWHSQHGDLQQGPLLPLWHWVIQAKPCPCQRVRMPRRDNSMEVEIRNLWPTPKLQAPWSR